MSQTRATEGNFRHTSLVVTKQAESEQATPSHGCFKGYLCMGEISKGFLDGIYISE